MRKRKKRKKRENRKDEDLGKRCATLPILFPFVEVKRGKENPLMESVKNTLFLKLTRAIFVCLLQK